MAKRRYNGEGSFRKRSDGRWEASLAVADETGKTKRKSVYGRTKAEAKAKFDALKKQQSDGVFFADDAQTLSDWLKHWLENIAKPDLRPASYADYEATVRNHILSDLIASVRLAKLNPESVENYLTRLRASGNSSRVISKAYVALNRSLNVAAKRRRISNNPCQYVDKPRYDSGEAKTLSRKQLQTLLQACEGERLAPLVKLAIATGMRLGELLGLQWDDIDFERSVLTVRRAQSEYSGKVTFGKPKTRAGSRTISLDAYAIQTLEEHRKQMFAEGNFDKGGFVFVAAGGGLLRRSNMRRDFWNPLLQETGIKVPFHALRHTSATLMLASGVHPKVAQQRLGHSKVAMTLDIYSHVLDGMDSEAAGLIGDAMRAASLQNGAG